MIIPFEQMVIDHQRDVEVTRRCFLEKRDRYYHLIILATFGTTIDELGGPDWWAHAGGMLVRMAKRDPNISVTLYPTAIQGVKRGAAVGTRQT